MKTVTDSSNFESVWNLIDTTKKRTYQLNKKVLDIKGSKELSLSINDDLSWRLAGDGVEGFHDLKRKRGVKQTVKDLPWGRHQRHLISSYCRSPCWPRGCGSTLYQWLKCRWGPFSQRWWQFPRRTSRRPSFWDLQVDMKIKRNCGLPWALGTFCFWLTTTMLSLLGPKVETAYS